MYDLLLESLYSCRDVMFKSTLFNSLYSCRDVQKTLVEPY
jgi:hypothetical protein